MRTGSMTMPYYEPWVGNNYEGAPYSGSRLLFVGESSYERNFKSQPSHLRKDTAALAAGTFGPKYSGFWRYIQRSVTGAQQITVKSQHEFWEGVALVNLIQRPMSTKYKRPNKKDFQYGVSALRSYINELNPEGIVVYSKSAWPALIQGLSLVADRHPLVKKSPPDPISDSKYTYHTSVFPYATPQFLLLRHPSSRPKLRAIKWFDVIRPFLQRLRNA